MYITNISSYQEWNDYNLRWNESEYGGIKDLRITPNKLWKPDVLMYNRYVIFCRIIHSSTYGIVCTNKKKLHAKIYIKLLLL